MITNKFDSILINSTDFLKTIVKKDKLFHLIGIGGCGMSGIAKVMLEMGYNIQGSDIHESDYTKELKQVNGDIQIFFNHSENNVKDADIIIFSDVVDDSNPELQYALQYNIPIVQRALFLDYLMTLSKISIAISGTHGKTTTTSFISILLQESGKCPTFINGGIINIYKSNAKSGNGNFSVYEACEAFGNIQYFNPSISVVTNVELDHMEFYKTQDNLSEYFNQFINRTKDLCVIDIDTKLSKDLYDKNKKLQKIKAVSLNNISADVFAKDICVALNSTSFIAVLKLSNTETKELSIEIPVIGNHNVKNALCAIYIGKYIGLSDSEIQQSCKKFTGNKHRFSNVATVNGISIIDDYGHHPSEILSVINTAKTIISPNSDITVIFEPHKYSRFATCWDGFKKVFSGVTNLIITPIFESGESKIPGITQDNFVKEMLSMKNSKLKNCVAVKSFDDIVSYINKFCKEFDLVLSFPAGALKDYIYSIPAQIEMFNRKHI